RDTAAILPNVLLFEWLHGSFCLQLGQRQGVAVAPFRRGHIRPTQPAGQEIVLVIADHPEKLAVGVENPTFPTPDNYADDVGIDEAANFRFALFDLALRGRDGFQVGLQRVATLQQQFEVHVAVSVATAVENTNRSEYRAIGPTDGHAEVRDQPELDVRV